MKILGLKNLCRNANVVSIVDDNNQEQEILFSYESPVAIKDSVGKLTVFPDFDYSVSTSKHIKAFTGWTAREIKTKLKSSPEFYKYSETIEL